MRALVTAAGAGPGVAIIKAIKRSGVPGAFVVGVDMGEDAAGLYLADAGERVPERPRRKGAAHGRRKLPRNLPRRRVVVDLPEAQKHCACGRDLTRIGETVSEKLDYVPASYTVVETVVPRYTCPQCHDGVIAADVPPQAVEKSLAAEGFIAQVVVSKYADHLPLHRQSRILARQGLDFPRSTLCDLVAAGLLNKQIAHELGMSEKTVKVHRGRLTRKLDVDSVAALVRLLSNRETRNQ